MFTLRKDFRFEASHQLPLHDGKCARLHGHSWKGTVVIKGPDLMEEGAKQGMLIDYGDISAAIKNMVENQLDHWHLNDTLKRAGMEGPPTSENIAKWVYHKLKPLIDRPDRLVWLVAVVIEETCTARCEYSE